MDKVRFKGAFAFTNFVDPHLMIGGVAESYDDQLTRGVMLVQRESGFGLRCTIFDDNGIQTSHNEYTVYTASEMKDAGIEYYSIGR